MLLLATIWYIGTGAAVETMVVDANFAALECWLHDCVYIPGMPVLFGWSLVLLLKLHSRELLFNQHPIQLLIIILEVAVLFRDSFTSI